MPMTPAGWPMQGGIPMGGHPGMVAPAGHAQLPSAHPSLYSQQAAAQSAPTASHTRRPRRTFKIELDDGKEPEWATEAKKRAEVEAAASAAEPAATQAPAPPSPSHLKKSDDAPTAPAPMSLPAKSKEVSSGEAGPQNLQIQIRATRKDFDVKDESGNTPVWVSKPGQGQGKDLAQGYDKGELRAAPADVASTQEAQPIAQEAAAKARPQPLAPMAHSSSAPERLQPDEPEPKAMQRGQSTTSVGTSSSPSHFGPPPSGGHGAPPASAARAAPRADAVDEAAAVKAAPEASDSVLDEPFEPGKFSPAQLRGIRKAMAEIPSRSASGPAGLLAAGLLGFSLAPRYQTKEKKKGKGGKGRRHDRDRFSEAERMRLVASLKRVQNRYDPNVKQALDEYYEATRKVTAVLNKLTAGNQKKMMKQFEELKVKSHRMLVTIVDLIFDKALKDKQFQGVMAALIRDIKPLSTEWVKGYVEPLFVSEEEAEDNKALQEMRMAAVQTVMEAVDAKMKKPELGALALAEAKKIHAAIEEQAAALETPKVTDEEGGAASGAGAGAGSSSATDEELQGMSPYKQVADLVNGKSTYGRTEETLKEELEQLKKEPVEAGWYFDQSGDQQTPPPVRCNKATDEASALQEGIRRSQLENLLGSRVMKEFKRQDQFAALEEAKLKDEKALEDAQNAGSLTKPLRDQLEQKRLERVEEHMQIKKQLLSNISFVSHIFLQRVLPPTIIQVSLKHLLLGHLSHDTLVAAKEVGESPDEQSVECLCNLIMQVGGPFSKFEDYAVQKRPGYKPFMPKVHEVLSQLQQNDDLDIRLRFLCYDVLDAESRGWVVKGKHVAALQTTTTQEEFQKKQAAEERAAAMKQQRGRGRGGGRGGGGRDFRQGGGGGRHGHGGRQDSGRRLQGSMSKHGGNSRASGGAGGPMLTRNTEGAKGAAFMRARGKDPAVGGRAPGSAGSSRAAGGSTGGWGGRAGRDSPRTSTPSRGSGGGSGGGWRSGGTTGGSGAARGGAGSGAASSSSSAGPTPLKKASELPSSPVAASPAPGKEPAYSMTDKEVELKAVSMLGEYKGNEGVDSRDEDAAVDFEEGLKADPATFAYRFVGYASVGMLDSHGPKLASTVAPMLVGLVGQDKLGKEDIQKGLCKGMEKFSSVAMEAPKLPQFFDEILGGLLEAGLIDYDTICGMLPRAVAVGKGIACFAGSMLKAAAGAKVGDEEVEAQLARLAPASPFDLGQGAPKLSPECKSRLPSLVQAVDLARSMDGCNPEAVAAAAAKGADSAAPEVLARVISVAACGACGNKNRKNEAGMAAAVDGIAGVIKSMLGGDAALEAQFLEGVAGVVREDFMFPVAFGPKVIVKSLQAAGALSGGAAAELRKVASAPGPAGPKTIEQVSELIALL